MPLKTLKSPNQHASNVTNQENTRTNTVADETQITSHGHKKQFWKQKFLHPQTLTPKPTKTTAITTKETET